MKKKDFRKTELLRGVSPSPSQARTQPRRIGIAVWS